MAINKAFVVKNSLEVNQKLILADATTGKVGIGTSQPKYLLDVAGGIGVTDIYAVGIVTLTNELNIGIGGTTLTALGTGLVGIGTINPIYLLDVRSPVSIGQTALYVKGDARITGDLVVEDDLILDEITTRNLNVTGVSTTNILNVTGVSTFTNGPVIIGSATSTGTASQTLQVTGGGYISGNLGIGTTTPGQPLSVIGNAYVSGNIGAGVPSPVYYLEAQDGINIKKNTGTNLAYLYFNGTGTRVSYSDATGNLSFFTNSTERAYVGYNGGFNIISGGLNVTGGPSLIGSATSTGTALQRLQVTGGSYVSGNVGIATTNPQSALDVLGDVKVSGIVTTSALAVAGITTTRNFQVIGVSTLGTVQVSSGIVTASAGIVTYYGDGSKLTGVIASGGGTIGVRSEGTYVGGGVTTLDFKTTTGTNVAVSAPSSGIATVTVQPGVSLGLAIALGG